MRDAIALLYGMSNGALDHTMANAASAIDRGELPAGRNIAALSLHRSNLQDQLAMCALSATAATGAARC